MHLLLAKVYSAGIFTGFRLLLFLLLQVSVDLSAKRLADLHKSGIDVVKLLGESFQSIIQFYNHIEEGLIPRTLDALSGMLPRYFMTSKLWQGALVALVSFRAAASTGLKRCEEFRRQLQASVVSSSTNEYSRFHSTSHHLFLRHPGGENQFFL